MAEKGFEPLSSQLGISGTSYRLQLGLINGKWASRLLRGKDVLDSYVYKDIEVEGDFPNQNYIVGWVLRTVAIPNINPHQIMKTTQVLVKQAIEKKTQKKVVAPVSETKDISLRKVSDTELRRPQQKGWVKPDGVKTPQDIDEEQRRAFKERMAGKPEETTAGAGTTPATVRTTRNLPSIPGGTQQKETQFEASSTKKEEASNFCPYCGKDLDFKFCPFCGKPLRKNEPHEHF